MCNCQVCMQGGGNLENTASRETVLHPHSQIQGQTNISTADKHLSWGHAPHNVVKHARCAFLSNYAFGEHAFVWKRFLGELSKRSVVQLPQKNWFLVLSVSIQRVLPTQVACLHKLHRRVKIRPCEWWRAQQDMGQFLFQDEAQILPNSFGTTPGGQKWPAMHAPVGRPRNHS